MTRPRLAVVQGEAHRVVLGTGTGAVAAVSCPGGVTVLEALLEAGVPVRYGCFTGSCGRCLARLVTGRIDHPSDRPGVSEHDRLAGQVLLCQTRPLSDLVIEATVDDGDRPFVPPRTFTATVGALEDIARETRRLRLLLDRPLHYLPGQYLRLEVPGASVPRAYSIATPPAPDGVSEVELHVRLVRGGLATERYVFGSLQVGDTVHLRAPYGRFVLREAEDHPLLFVAGGTGLAPIESMVHAAVAGGMRQPIVLYHGVRTKADLYDCDVLEALAARHPNLSYRPVLSEEEWPGRTGLVTEAVARDFESLRGWTAYLCGPPPMVDAAAALLARLRVPGRLIRREEFF